MFKIGSLIALFAAVFMAVGVNAASAKDRGDRGHEQCLMSSSSYGFMPCDNKDKQQKEDECEDNNSHDYSSKIDDADEHTCPPAQADAPPVTPVTPPTAAPAETTVAPAAPMQKPRFKRYYCIRGLSVKLGSQFSQVVGLVRVNVNGQLAAMRRIHTAARSGYPVHVGLKPATSLAKLVVRVRAHYVTRKGGMTYIDKTYIRNQCALHRAPSSELVVAGNARRPGSHEPQILQIPITK